jgi:hypothetical protein
LLHLNGGTPDVTPTTATVALERLGNTVIVRSTDPSSTLRVDLRLSNDTLSGTASGTYGNTGRVVQLQPGLNSGAALVNGTLMADRAIGKLTGEVAVNGSGCSNNNHNWTLSPR